MSTSPHPVSVPDPMALGAIRDVVGASGWIDADADLEPYLVEERGLFRGHCAAVVRPASTEQAAAVAAICADAGIAIVPQGGNTGLVGGGVPAGGIVLCLSRMHRVRGLDRTNRTITVEAGMILADVQAAADDAGLLFPLSLAAEGSCRIGGNLATNAGGINVLRYGNARDLVLGLEVVLADGRVWDGLRGLRKDNTGYDLKQVFIGSEGTLGIITAAVLKLFPKPRTRVTALAALPHAAAALDLLDRLQDTCGDSLTAFEYMERRGIDFCLTHVPGNADPFTDIHPCYALVSLTSPRPDDPLDGDLERVLEDAFESGAVIDAVIAQSEGQAADLWRIRESIPEGQKPEGGSIKNDVSVPVSKVPAFLERANAAVTAALPGIRVVAFGHLGDGNIHYNLTRPEGMDTQEFLAQWDRFDRIVSGIAMELGGSFSAEHGIGRLKTVDMARYKSPEALALVRALKGALDPAGILNPGKILAP